MAGLITIDFSELSGVLKSISELPNDLAIEVDAELEEGARQFTGLVKLKAPGDTGRLRGSANYAPTGRKMSYESFVQTNYAAYQEWGTIQYVSVPPELRDIAIKYKGKGIKKTGGVKPKHYFFSNMALVIPSVIQNINNVVEQRLSKK
jgi:hypothetical protein